MTEFKTKLLSAERSLVNNEDEATATAFKACQDGSKTSRSFPFKCHRCQRLGHKAADCRVDLTKHGRNDRQQRSKKTTEEKCKDAKQGIEPKKFYVASSAMKATTSSGSFILDCGATDHMASHREWFTSFSILEEPQEICGVDSTSPILATGIGNIEAEVSVDERRWTSVTWTNVLYVLKLGSIALISLQQLMGKGCINGDGSSILVTESCGTPLVKANELNGLYVLELRLVSPNPSAYVGSKTSCELWHRRFGHVSNETLRVMSSNNLVENFKFVNESRPACDGCFLGKQTVSSHPSRLQPRNLKSGESIHSDVCDAGATSWDGHRYLVVFKCEFSAYRSGRVFRRCCAENQSRDGKRCEDLSKRQRDRVR